MNKKICFLGFLAVTMLLLAGKVMVVKVLHSQLLAKPDFLSSNLATIGILGLINNPHASAADYFKNGIRTELLANHMDGRRKI